MTDRISASEVSREKPAIMAFVRDLPILHKEGLHKEGLHKEGLHKEGLHKEGLEKGKGRNALWLPPAAPETHPPGRGYSRFVALMRRLLPAVAAALLLLVAVWPRLPAIILGPNFGGVGLDPRAARDLRMVKARFSGTDKENRPYVLTADVARQMSNQDDLISLEGPKADMTLQSGSWLFVSAYTGVYQPQEQNLDLFGSVKLIDDRGMEFTTDSARVNMATGGAESREKVEGQGTFGDVTAEGFQVLDHGATIIFNGKSKLHLNPRTSTDGTR